MDRGRFRCGHLKVPRNMRRKGDGMVRCAICARISDGEYKLRKRQEAPPPFLLGRYWPKPVTPPEAV